MERKSKLRASIAGGTASQGSVNFERFRIDQPLRLLAFDDLAPFARRDGVFS